MSTVRDNLFTIHITGIDDFLAARLVQGERPLSFTVSGADSEGNITLISLDTPAEDHLSGEGVDFELFTCECRGLDTADIKDYLQRPVYTSSAYEFFDFALGSLSSFDCFIEFTGNAWRVRVQNPKSL